MPILFAVVGGCSRIGLNLPSDAPDPIAAGRSVKPAFGWITTRVGPGAERAPDGSIALEAVRYDGRAVWQQVRRWKEPAGEHADSIILERSTLRPIVTTRMTPKGTWTVRYNLRSVDRRFTPAKGRGGWHHAEIVENAPYSALGIELVIAALPLTEGWKGILPVVVDTADHGWSWLRFEVMREMSLTEKPNWVTKSSWVVDYTLNGEQTRLWIAQEGRSVRRIEKIGPDNEVLHSMRRVLLGQ
ncbi:MAG: hypothetical protein IPP98_13280 [Gemmatimonadetes bacterium]|nr:hypothetical protein [Gemmatimonadota bacterium]